MQGMGLGPCSSTPLGGFYLVQDSLRTGHCATWSSSSPAQALLGEVTQGGCHRMQGWSRIRMWSFIFFFVPEIELMTLRFQGRHLGL